MYTISCPYQTGCEQLKYCKSCATLTHPFKKTTKISYSQYRLVVEHFSKRPAVALLKEIAAPTIARAIHDQWICRYEIIHRVHSDSAFNVHGHVMHEVAKIFWVVKSKTSNLGLSEAMEKLVESCMQNQVDQFGRNWTATCNQLFTCSFITYCSHRLGSLLHSMQRKFKLFCK